MEEPLMPIPPPPMPLRFCGVSLRFLVGESGGEGWGNDGEEKRGGDEWRDGDTVCVRAVRQEKPTAFTALTLKTDKPATDKSKPSVSADKKEGKRQKKNAI